MLLKTIPELPAFSRRWVKAAIVLAAIFFCAPLISALALDAGFLSLANETLAYRFFYSERMLAGETLAVGVGYLVSVVHHIVYLSMHVFPSVAAASLETRLDLFSLLTIGALSATLCGILFIAIRSSRLLLIDHILLVMTMLVPLYGTVIMGFLYALMADYHLVNIILCTATLLLFQWVWRNTSMVSRPTVIALGIFVGIAMANKITMLVPAGVILVPAVFHRSAKWHEILLRTLLAMVGMVAAFALVHLLSYLGSVPRTLAGLRIWWAFASNPGFEPAFWTDLFNVFIVGFNYGYFFAYSLGVLLFFTIALAIRRELFNWTSLLVLIYCVAAFGACLFFVGKRPAGSTLFDSTLFIFTLSAVIFTVTTAWKSARLLIVLSFAGWIALAGVTFSAGKLHSMIASSRLDSKIKWAVFDFTRQLANGRPIEVIYPDNSFHHEGPFELLFKAATDFPTWQISTGKRTILDRYAPGMSFRHNPGETTPKMPYDGGRVLVWFDLPESQPLEMRYRELAKILSRSGVSRFSPNEYSHHLEMYNSVKIQIALIP